MAAKTLLLNFLAGKTLLCDVYTANMVTKLTASPLSFTESGTIPGSYTAVMNDLGAGNGLCVAIKDAGGIIAWSNVDLVEAVGRYKIQDSPTAGEFSTQSIDLSGIPPISIVIPSSTAAASMEESVFSCVRGDTVIRTLPLMGDISTRVKLEFTVKLAALLDVTESTDGDALIHATEDDGLDVLNGSDSGLTAADVVFDVLDEDTGEVSITLKPRVTSVIASGLYRWDAQWIDASGRVYTPIGGQFVLSADVSQAIA